MFEQNITLFNKYGDRWHKTILSQCIFYKNKGSVMSKTGARDTSAARVIIPQILKGYVHPDDFKGEAGTWTLRAEDIIIPKELNENYSNPTKDLRQFDDFFLIVAVDTYDFATVMDCFEVYLK